MTNDILDDFTAEKNSKAPTGLIVLAILTLIWDALIIIGLIAGAVIVSNLLDTTGAVLPTGSLIVFTIIVVLSLLNVIGVAKMLKLKMAGYWMYLITNIIYIISSLIVAFGMSNSPKNAVNSEQLQTSITMFVIIALVLALMTFLFSRYYKLFKR